MRNNPYSHLIIAVWLIVLGFAIGAVIGYSIPAAGSSDPSGKLVITATFRATSLTPDSSPQNRLTAGEQAAEATSDTSQPPTPIPFDRSAIQRVLIISVDGLRPDAIVKDGQPTGYMPNVFNLAQRGTASWTAQTIEPSATIPGHAAMVTGYGPLKNGIDRFEYNVLMQRAPYIQVPTIFERATQSGKKVAVIFGKKKLDYLLRPDAQEIEHAFATKNDAELGSVAREVMQSGFDLMLVHFIDVDHAGETHEWMSQEYLEAAKGTDQVIQSLLDQLQVQNLLESTLIIITADHGGHDVGHTQGKPEDLTIPWVIAGPGIKPSLVLTDPVIYGMDTAATAMWALGLELPADLDGRPILEAFGMPALPSPFAVQITPTPDVGD
jgi:hypothetical protein